MSIELAFAFPHPPLAVPEVGRGGQADIQKTLDAFDEAAAEIAALEPETIVFMTPHSCLYSDYFHISPGSSAVGDLGRFAAGGVKFSAQYDRELAKTIAELARRDSLAAGPLGEKDAALDHGVSIPMWFINRRYDRYMTVRISQSGFDGPEHYRLGQLIAEAARETGRRTVFVASGDLSHKLSASGPYGFAAAGKEFDDRIIGAFSSGDFYDLFFVSDELRRDAAECGYNSFMALAGCLDRRRVCASLLSYEGPFGVGYAVARFKPTAYDESRALLDRYTKGLRDSADADGRNEDEYCALARRSLEYTLKHGGTMPLPEGLPDELLQSRAGVFVSFHKDDRLRGCIGTISPTTGCIALEIIKNAVSAGLADYRFSPVSERELPLLSCKVDVLTPPELIANEDELDVRRYGVIVSSGAKRGLLLPDLDGVDSVRQQVAIAREKGGIAENEPLKLERFEVIRHE